MSFILSNGKYGDLESPELHPKSKGFKSVSAVPSKPSAEIKAFYYAWNAGYKFGLATGRLRLKK